MDISGAKSEKTCPPPPAKAKVPMQMHLPPALRIGLVLTATTVGVGLIWLVRQAAVPLPPVQPTLRVSAPPTASAGPAVPAAHDSAPPVPVTPSRELASSTPTPPVSARVRLADDKIVELAPNALGLFPRVLLAKEQTVSVTAHYPAADPGEVLVISAEDGGQVNGSSPVQAAPLDANRSVTFRFTTTQNEGVFRVTLRRASEQQQFDFWVGPEPVLQTATPSL